MLFVKEPLTYGRQDEGLKRKTAPRLHPNPTKGSENEKEGLAWRGVRYHASTKMSEVLVGIHGNEGSLFSTLFDLIH